ncbi:hypothetical protein E3N88_43152 [Mikania micrantha]|uniref:Uncharacterized protein n=1 Tax=Mikania micrantha TaxID=192012 RepID=A0A5N6LFR0_9ASTR|nr:hypothetical protein E3N88_43152 [Mikania micrantha]
MDILRGFSSSYAGGVNNTTALQYNNMEVGVALLDQQANEHYKSDGFEHSEGHMTNESEESEFPPPTTSQKAKAKRLSLKHPASSSGVPKTAMNDVTKVLMDEGSKVPMKDAPDKNESHTLSQDAIEFYNNGDAPYCYSRILGLNKLHTDFWGVL